MRRTIILSGLLAFTALALMLAAPSSLSAQEPAVTVPEYGPQTQGSYGLPGATPGAAGETDSSNGFTIPIPGGGNVTVEGPDAPAPNQLPPLGGDTWSNHQQSPYMPGASPMSPRP